MLRVLNLLESRKINIPGILFILVACNCFAVLQGYAEVNENKLLLVRGEDHYPPYEFLDDEGYPAGFNVDIMKAVAEVMGLKLDIQLRPWSMVREDIEAGKIDISIGMFRTAEREKLVDFSTPYNVVSYALFIRKGVAISSLKDLSYRDIVVQNGDFAHDYLIKQGLDHNLVLVENMEDALRKLASGRYDCAIISKLYGLYIVKGYNLSNIESVDLQIESLENCFAVAKGNLALLSQLNEGLSIIKATGRYEELYRKWFSIYEDRLFTREVLKYVVWLVTPLGILLIGVGCWSWFLKRQVFLKTKELREELSERKRAELELKKSHELLRELTMHLHMAREEERGQIAREVHDELGQIFTALQLDLYYMKQKYPQKKGPLIDKMDNMLKLIDSTCVMIQEISTRLRPRLLDHLGLIAAMEWYLEDYERRTGIKCIFKTNSEKLNLEENLSITIFRIFQEALTNVARHAKAKTVSINLREKNNVLLLTIKDNGKGITQEQISNPKSIGLIGMRERLSPWQGRFEISGVPNRGTTLIIELALDKITAAR